MSTLAGDHRACAAILARSSSSFALPIRLLPEAKRRGTTALYAFCRVADDLVDDAADAVTAATGLGALATATEAALAGHTAAQQRAATARMRDTRGPQQPALPGARASGSSALT